MRRKTKPIYLASQSARRKEILSQMKIVFRVVQSSYRERFKKNITPRALVLEHAIGKAKMAKLQRKEGFVLGADTLVYASGKFYGKPKSEKAATKMLLELSGRSHWVYTGVAVRNVGTGKLIKGYEKTKVWLKRLTHSEIIAYHKKVYPLDKAGAYAIQASPKIVQKIEGSRTNVIGLPVGLLKKLLLRA